MEEKPQQRRRFQFSLRTLLFTCLAFHLSIGFVGATSFVAFRCGYQWFGIYWMSSVRRFLIDDWGWSTKFVCSYGTFSMDALPTWIVLAPICFLLGLARSKYAHIFAWAIAAAMPVASAISDSQFPALLMTSYVRVVSLFATAIVLGCWWLGWFSRGRTEQQRNEFQSWWMQGILTVLIVTISSYGWWVITLPLGPM